MHAVNVTEKLHDVRSDALVAKHWSNASEICFLKSPIEHYPIVYKCDTYKFVERHITVRNDLDKNHLVQ